MVTNLFKCFLCGWRNRTAGTHACYNCGADQRRAPQATEAAPIAVSVCSRYGHRHGDAGYCTRCGALS